MFNKGFMLTCGTAQLLYDKFAKDAPIYDYHCHLTAKEIYEDNVFEDISSLWLGCDHYKWRAMRYAGIDEKYITGTENGLSKFKMWARTCARLIGSPLYHWTNMELSTFFKVDEFLNEENAEKIYGLCNEIIRSEKLSPSGIIDKSKVKLICTTDDPVDDLQYHRLFKRRNDKDFSVLPGFRPDRILNLPDRDFSSYIGRLSQCCEMNINSIQDLVNALKKRINYFSGEGCVLADHSVESLAYIPAGQEEVEVIFAKRLLEEEITNDEAEKYRYFILKSLAKEYRESGWTMQMHIGALRHINDVMQKSIGPDTGYDIMNDFHVAVPLAQLINDINNDGGLPKTVFYTLNYKDNPVLSSLPHCFTEAGVAGKLQFGAAWWFNDNREGIYSHLKAIANQGMLAYFIGMLTDSRSFLSYVRHDYFRRILCSFVGELVENGEFICDELLLKEIIEGICYRNIINYMGLK